MRRLAALGVALSCACAALAGCGAPASNAAPVAIEVPAPLRASSAGVAAAPRDREAPAARVFVRFDGQEHGAPDQATVHVPRAVFDLVFELRVSRLEQDERHPVRVAFSNDGAMFALPFGSTEGSAASLGPFGAHTYYASGGESYRPWMVSGTAHHALHFDPASEDPPLALVERLGDGRARVALRVHSLVDPRRRMHYAPGRYPSDRIFVALWFDDDDDLVLERSEVVRAALIFDGPPQALGS